ncbi:MAG: SAVED domain-containing protein [Candidatus Gastranaerophilaceae bacterium]
MWELSVKNANPDILKTKENLYDFKQSVRKLLEEIKLHYKEGTILKIFPVMPVSACIELGRLYLPKADMPLEIYNQESVDAEFKYAISIKGDL